MYAVRVALRVDFDSAAAKAVDQQAQLASTSATLNTVTIGLIAWAVAISVAVAVMATLIVRRMRVLRARAQRLAARRRHDDGVLPYDAESHHDQPPSSAASPDDAPSHRGRDTAMVVDLDLDDSDGRMAASSPRTLQPRPQEA